MLTFDKCEIFGTNYSPFSLTVFGNTFLEIAVDRSESYEQLIQFLCFDQLPLRGKIFLNNQYIHRFNRKKYASYVALCTLDEQKNRVNCHDSVDSVLKGYCNSGDSELRMPLVKNFWRLDPYGIQRFSEVPANIQQRIVLAKLMCRDDPIIVLDDVFRELLSDECDLLLKLLAVRCDNGAMVVHVTTQKTSMVPFSLKVSSDDFKK